MDKPYDEGSKVLFYDEKQNINHGVTCEIVKSYVGYGERTYYDAYLNDDKRNTVQVSHDQLYDDNPKNRKSFSVPDKHEPVTPSTKKYVKPNDDLPAGMARCECCEIVKAREQFYANKKRFCSKSCSHSYSARHRQGYQRGRKPSESYANAHNAQRERKEQDRNMPLSSYIRKYKPGREEVLKIMTTDKDKEIIEKVASNWNWSIYLEEKRAIAAPVSYFKYAVLRDMLSNGSMVGAMVEVKNMDAPKQLEGFWIAQIIEEGGYRAKLRYLGTEHKSKMDFWVNLFVDGNVDCVGHSVNEGLPMLPPWCVGSSQIEDYSFLVEVVSKCRTLPIDWKDIVQEHLASPVKIGSRLEIMDPSCLYHCRIGIVREVIGGRIRVEYEDKKADEQNFWTHIKSEAVHPIGWSDKVGTKMQSKLKKNYTRVPGVENVPQELFATLPEWDKSKHGQFEVGMKLETVDPLKLSTIRVGTVMKVLKHGYFIVGIDGMDVLRDAESKCYIHHYTSTSVFPAGYSRQNNVRVQGPEQFHENNGAGHFMWSKYLDHCDAIAAPSKLFQCERTPTSNPCHQFKVGMKLEAVDLLNPHLICVATVVKCMAGSLLQIHFDGWVDDHDQWLDANCAHLFPVGWCELFGYELQIPDTSTDEEDKVEVEKEEAGEQQERKKRSKSKSPRKRNKRRNAGKNNSLDEDFMTEEYQDFIE